MTLNGKSGRWGGILLNGKQGSVRLGDGGRGTGEYCQGANLATQQHKSKTKLLLEL